MSFVRNSWYPAGFASRMGVGLHKRRVLREDLVVRRQPDGRFAALEDRCPHPFLPLSMGCLENGNVQCKAASGRSGSASIRVP